MYTTSDTKYPIHFINSLPGIRCSQITTYFLANAIKISLKKNVNSSKSDLRT